MCRSDTSETKTQQKRAFPCAAIGTYSPLRFLRALQKASTHLFPTLSPPLSPLLQFVFNFLFVSYVEYCFVPFTAAPLICGIPFIYRVSAVRFAWLCGGDWIYCLIGFIFLKLLKLLLKLAAVDRQLFSCMALI